MSKTKLFQAATRGKYRFPYRGLLSIEDLWDVSLEGLDAIYKTLNSELKKSSEESLLSMKTKSDEDLENKIEIVKYIVSVKLAEREAAINATLKSEKRKKIQEIIAAKQDEDLRSASIEDLQKMLDDLTD